MSADLTGFLLARIAEDEDLATEAAALTEVRWYVDPAEASVRGVIEYRVTDDRGPTGMVVDPHLAHIARHDPARVLADCEAKRRIVETRTCCRVATADVDRCPLLRALAFVYADHEDFQEAWRV
jgi:uncharacterized protein DUF6221